MAGNSMPTDIVVRKAQAEDAEVVVGLIKQLGSDSSITAAYVSSYLEGTNNKILLAERQGRVDGLLSYSVRPDLFHAGNSMLIEELVVDENFRGEGVGSLLINALMERLKELDCREVCLAVMPDNEPAIRFYRSHGLVEQALFLEKHF
jgi:ribosomal protein S18 acetylase RimI-like enzyme